jgi:hypothetical protein
MRRINLDLAEAASQKSYNDQSAPDQKRGRVYTA